MLVNNAGILRDRMLVNMTEAEWDAVIKVHLKGTFAPAHHAAAYWREQVKPGQPVDARIINTTSVSGIYGNAGQTNYGAAKAGIAAFTIIAARELRRYGITVNAIAPGALTRMTEDLGMGQASEEDKARMHPRWIAPIVTWLASAESAHITGRVFEASGAVLAVAEGWHRGPTVAPVDDPTQIGPLVDELMRTRAQERRAWTARTSTEHSAIDADPAPQAARDAVGGAGGSASGAPASRSPTSCAPRWPTRCRSITTRSTRCRRRRRWSRASTAAR